MVTMYNGQVWYTLTYILAGAVILPYYSYQSYSHPVHIYDLNCTGIEDSVWGCSHNKNIWYCSPYYDASVLCQCKLTTV